MLPVRAKLAFHLSTMRNISDQFSDDRSNKGHHDLSVTDYLCRKVLCLETSSRILLRTFTKDGGLLP